ncbi:acetamidase/formamidase family protein [SAR202 cluster bacterium AD-804-J14_MRT_500m]|nr:acetamidase/formamidase family protein [SAR202 cluster bacterium AD-804-J14_MRT_500m]
MRSINIDRSKRLKSEPDTGHNRWHPDISPILEASEGEEIVLETRDALDGQLGPGITESDFSKVESGAIHPLTGPVYIQGAEPGDLLEVEFLDIIPQPFGFSAIIPGFGFLRDVFTSPFMVHWKISDGWATSDQIPGIRIPGASFMGVSGVAPSEIQLQQWTAREADLESRGGLALPPDVGGSVPESGIVAKYGLRTLPPRENGGNFDVKQLSKGSKLFLPVGVEGALFSTGDAHFAQGDGEVCVTAVEIGATVNVKFRILKNEAYRKNIRWPRFQRDSYFIDPQWAVPRNFIATMGMPVTDDGVNHGEDLTLACRNALLNMIDLLQERGFSRNQAYVICSVGVDLKISNVVDVPNFVVSAFLPEEILHG